MNVFTCAVTIGLALPVPDKSYLTEVGLALVFCFSHVIYYFGGGDMAMPTHCGIGLAPAL